LGPNIYKFSQLALVLDKELATTFYPLASNVGCYMVASSFVVFGGSSSAGKDNDQLHINRHNHMLAVLHNMPEFMDNLECNCVGSSRKSSMDAPHVIFGFETCSNCRISIDRPRTLAMMANLLYHLDLHSYGFLLSLQILIILIAREVEPPHLGKACHDYSSRGRNEDST